MSAPRQVGSVTVIRYYEVNCENHGVITLEVQNDDV